MRGLTIILNGDDASNGIGLAFQMALVQIALGQPMTLFVTGWAVRNIVMASKSSGKGFLGIKVTPSLKQLLNDVLDGGGRLIVCQTRMTTGGWHFDALDSRIEAGGLVSIMQGLGDDRLVVI